MPIISICCNMAFLLVLLFKFSIQGWKFVVAWLFCFFPFSSRQLKDGHLKYPPHVTGVLWSLTDNIQMFRFLFFFIHIQSFHNLVPADICFWPFHCLIEKHTVHHLQYTTVFPQYESPTPQIDQQAHIHVNWGTRITFALVQYFYPLHHRLLLVCGKHGRGISVCVILTWQWQDPPYFHGTSALHTELTEVLSCICICLPRSAYPYF